MKEKRENAMSDGVIGGEPVDRREAGVNGAAAPAALVLGDGAGAAPATAPASVKGKRGRGETVARWGVATEIIDPDAEAWTLRIILGEKARPELHKTEQAALRQIEALDLNQAWLVREVKIERKARLL